MTRRYAELWSKIANRETVTVRCHKTAAKTIKKAMQKEKWLHTRARKATELPSFGMMQIREFSTDVPTQVRLEFSLAYSGDNL